WGRRAVAAEGVIALEEIGPHVVDMDVLTGRDVTGGEADDLPVLVDRFAFPDGRESELVPEADAAGEGHDAAVGLHLLPGLERTGGDGDVIVGAQMHGDGRERHGGHEATSRRNQGRRVAVTIGNAVGSSKYPVTEWRFFHLWSAALHRR